MAPEKVAQQILECILNPVAEVYTHKGSKDYALLAAKDREKAEAQQVPVVLGERAIYDRIKATGK